MKIGTSIPAIIALFVLLCAPFSYMPICGSGAQRGLICYCCSGTGKKCSMISCASCPAKSGSEVSPWTPEIILNSHNPIIHLKPVYCETVSFHLPETVYLEVPVKPPNII